MAGSELEVIREHRPFEPFQWLPETLRLEFSEGIAMLQAAGREVRSRALQAGLRKQKLVEGSR